MNLRNIFSYFHKARECGGAPKLTSLRVEPFFNPSFFSSLGIYIRNTFCKKKWEGGNLKRGRSSGRSNLPPVNKVTTISRYSSYIANGQCKDYLFGLVFMPGWSPIQSSLMGALFLYTINIFVLPARRCPCPSPVRGGLCQQAELREEGGEQAIWGGGAST